MTNIETLESRKLLSVAVKFDPTTGFLGIVGDNSDDQIRVVVSAARSQDQASSIGVAGLVTSPTGSRGSRWDVNRARQDISRDMLLSGVTVFDRGTLIYNSARQGHTVQTVEVAGNAGADLVSVSNNNTQVSMRVFGGIGNDVLSATASNAPAPSIDAGDGDDGVSASFGVNTPFTAINGGAGNDSFEVTAVDGALSGGPVTRDRAIFGGAGNDRFILTALNSVGFRALGGDGDDVIVGSKQSDELYGEGGHDQIFAGEGDDYLNGGLGDDQLFAEGGNDSLDHGGGIDVIDGGEGKDRAIVDAKDKVTDVEEVLEG